MPTMRMNRTPRPAMGIKDDFVVCRTLLHAWDPFYDPDYQPQYGEPVSLRCARCGTVRHDVIAANGNLNGRYYVYPEGYGLIGVDDRPTRADFRVRFINERRHRK